LPLNTYSISAQTASPYPTNYLGSPFVQELALQWRHANGQLVSGSNTVNVSITPVGTAAFSVLNDATSTTTTNQFVNLLGSGPITVTGGVGTIFVHAGNVPGTATLSVTATDPDTGQSITSQGTITIAGAATGLPTSINISQSSTSGVYINGSNGAQSELITANVSNGNGAFVADPNDGQGGAFDNVQFQIVGPAGTDATLTAVNAAGKSQTGTTVLTSTHNGIASVTFLAGTQQGPVQVQATADRADNNVDNLIQSPVTATTSVVVSDGKLYTLTLTSPVVNAILVNGVSEQATLSTQNGSSTLTIPPAPDATYSLTVSATGSDRQGNPVLPGTSINFGAIDAPLTNANVFAISGAKGDPAEGGTLFTATDGLFTTAGGGAGPGDTLLVFGKAVAGNDDLESAVKVKAINNATSLTTATPFNQNDTTGVIVNNGPVLPYIIGRAQVGNITSPATTNSNGVASTTLNYPVSQLERASAIWAQGTGVDTVTGGTKTVTDIAVLAYPGLSPATITISPSPIPGGVTTTVDVCITDALSVPLPYISFTFGFSNLGIGSGSVDGITGSGTVKNLTGADGCVAVQVTTSGIAASTGSTGSPTLTFSAGPGTSKDATITASGTPVLLATPSILGGTGGQVTLQLLDSSGTPISGQQLIGTCTGDTSIGITSGPGITNAQGKTTATIIAALNQYATPGTGSCTFTTSTGTPSVKVTLQGTDLCLTNPGNAACGGKNLILNATPSALPGSGGTVTLVLLTSSGTPVPGVALTASCTGATVGVSTAPGTTNASGTTTATITANLDSYGSPGSGSCTFTTAGGSPTATVNVQGKNLCINDPTNLNCGGVVLSVSVIGGGGATPVYGTVTSTPSGISCVSTAQAPTQTCSQPFSSGTLVTLTAKPNPATGNVTWGGGCSAFAQSPVATVALTASASCTATFTQ
jgi:hypothetical protein